MGCRQSRPNGGNLHAVLIGVWGIQGGASTVGMWAWRLNSCCFLVHKALGEVSEGRHQSLPLLGWSFTLEKPLWYPARPVKRTSQEKDLYCIHIQDTSIKVLDTANNGHMTIHDFKGLLHDKTSLLLSLHFSNVTPA